MSSKTTIITIASSKGGVGKSTVCLMLAGALAARGQSVHIIDADENNSIARWYTQHKIDHPNLVATKTNPKTFSAALRESRAKSPDIILIDVAGVYEKTLSYAMGRSDLVIIPAQPSEPDLHEAQKIIQDHEDLVDTFNLTSEYRLLLNLCDPLHPPYQIHIFDEVARMKLKRFATLMYKRSPYREAFLNGELPHLSDISREAIGKAVAEIDAIIHEVDAYLEAKETVAERKQAA